MTRVEACWRWEGKLRQNPSHLLALKLLEHLLKSLSLAPETQERSLSVHFFFAIEQQSTYFLKIN